MKKKYEDYFIEENRVKDSVKEFYSESKKYKLLFSKFETEQGFSAFTQGQIFNEKNELITIVNRNYSSFPFHFVENHPDGHDYLLCGENYQGQTVIQLDTGKRTDWLTKEGKQGLGWCTIDYIPFPDKKHILVAGCFWAFPYELIIKDFSNPLELPWKIIKISEDKEAIFYDDNNIDFNFNNIDWNNLTFKETFEFSADGKTFQEIEDQFIKEGKVKVNPDKTINWEALSPVAEEMEKGYTIIKTYKADPDGRVYLLNEETIPAKEWAEICKDK